MRRSLSAVPRPVTARAAGKINLHLGVGARREDGFHELSTVFQAVSLYDDVTASPATAPAVEVKGAGAADVPTDETNLALRAAVLLAERTGRSPDVHLLIHKGIPVAGGMAGGSGDAAAALVACDALWGTGCGRDMLAELAAELGSDVPFSLHGGSALGTGRGEQLVPIMVRGEYSWVLALSREGLSTASVFRAFDERPRPRAARGSVQREGSPDGVLAALRTHDVVALGRALHNDLQRVAVDLRPDLQTILDLGLQLGALGGVVSGSGPTVALLVRGAAEAAELASGLSRRKVCAAVRRVEGPVPGARVVEDTEEQ